MFKFPNQTKSNVTNMPQRERWQSDAFINIFLPTPDGGKRKLGSIGLKVTKPAEAQLIQYLSEDPTRIVALMAHAEVDFRMADGSDSTGFALPTE
jgi:hypothetical protein